MVEFISNLQSHEAVSLAGSTHRQTQCVWSRLLRSTTQFWAKFLPNRHSFTLVYRLYCSPDKILKVSRNQLSSSIVKWIFHDCFCIKEKNGPSTTKKIAVRTFPSILLRAACWRTSFALRTWAWLEAHFLSLKKNQESFLISYRWQTNNKRNCRPFVDPLMTTSYKFVICSTYLYSKQLISVLSGMWADATP